MPASPRRMQEQLADNHRLFGGEPSFGIRGGHLPFLCASSWVAYSSRWARVGRQHRVSAPTRAGRERGRRGALSSSPTAGRPRTDSPPTRLETKGRGPEGPARPGKGGFRKRGGEAGGSGGGRRRPSFYIRSLPPARGSISQVGGLLAASHSEPLLASSARSPRVCVSGYWATRARPDIAMREKVSGPRSCLAHPLHRSIDSTGFMRVKFWPSNPRVNFFI